MIGNKFFKTVCITCMLTIFTGCGTSVNEELSQNSPAAGPSQTADNTALSSDADGDTQVGAENTKNDYITIHEVKSIVLENAGFAEENVKFVQLGLVSENGSGKYEVEFVNGTMEYDYMVDARTGEILSMNCEISDHDIDNIPLETSGESLAQADLPSSEGSQGAGQPEGNAPAGSRQKANNQMGNNQDSNNQSGSNDQYIGKEAAQQAALAHAGVSESDAQFLKVEFDYDDGRAEYEVEWDVGRTEYSCDVDAYTGQILSFEKDLD